MIDFKNSLVEETKFEGFEIYIKRDDLIHPDFSGNKARKFIYFLHKDLIDTKKIVSFGSNQSNAMYSLSVLCKLKNIEFIYYTEHISSFLKENPIGNYKYALQNGMKIYTFDRSPYPFLKNLSKTLSKKETLFIPEGGRCETSQYGIDMLAKELIEFKRSNYIDKLHIFLPSGTGTTALFLQQSIKSLQDNSIVYTVACVGGKEYLKKQFFDLCKDERYHPEILDTKKYHFGKLDCQLYEFWIKLCSKTGIEFDLLYDPIGFREMIRFLHDNKVKNREKILYIHQGGVKGNESMIQRYKRKCDENSKHCR